MIGLFIIPVTGAVTGGAPFLGRLSLIVGGNLSPIVGGSFAIYYGN
jgi:hypothetical protein